MVKMRRGQESCSPAASLRRNGVVGLAHADHWTCRQTRTGVAELAHQSTSFWSNAISRQVVRGLFSATQIARQLGAAIQTTEIARTFSEIESMLAR